MVKPSHIIRREALDRKECGWYYDLMEYLKNRLSDVWMFGLGFGSWTLDRVERTLDKDHASVVFAIAGLVVITVGILVLVGSIA